MSLPNGLQPLSLFHPRLWYWGSDGTNIAATDRFYYHRSIHAMVHVVTGASDTGADIADDIDTKVTEFAALNADNDKSDAIAIIVQNMPAGSDTADDANLPCLFKHKDDVMAGEAANGSDTQSPFMANGVTALANYIKDGANDLLDQMASNGTTAPSRWFFDAESRPDDGAVARTNWTVAYDEARAGTEQVVGTSTLEALGTAEGVDYSTPEWSDGELIGHANNIRMAGWYKGIMLSICDKAMNDALYSKIRAAFPSCKCCNYRTSVGSNTNNPINTEEGTIGTAGTDADQQQYMKPVVIPTADMLAPASYVVHQDWPTTLGSSRFPWYNETFWGANFYAMAKAYPTKPIVPWLSYIGYTGGQRDDAESASNLLAVMKRCWLANMINGNTTEFQLWIGNTSGSTITASGLDDLCENAWVPFLRWVEDRRTGRRGQ